MWKILLKRKSKLKNGSSIYFKLYIGVAVQVEEEQVEEEEEEEMSNSMSKFCLSYSIFVPYGITHFTANINYTFYRS